MSITWILHVLLLLPSFFLPIHGPDLFPSSAKLSNSWNITTGGFYNSAGSRVKSILSEKIFNSTEQPAICFGFINRLSPDEFVVSFLAIAAHSDCFQDNEPPQVFWSPNRNKPVKGDGTLEFDSQGDLVLRDGDGTLVWSTNTPGKFVVGMKITATGNLLLYDANNRTVWSSFDHATDTWLPGQKLVLGQKLTANTSPSNWTTGVFYLSVTDAGLCAYIDSNPPQRYRKYFTRDRSISPKNVRRSIRFKTGSLNFTDVKTSSPISADYIPDSGNGFQYMRMDTDGHLRVYQWDPAKEIVVDDILTIEYSNCSYPTVCGSFGICSDGQCTCPVERGGDQSYFKPYDYRHLNLGCQETTQLSCNSSEVHLIEIADVTYIGFAEVMVNTDIENCKQACLNNCSCKAALFRSYEYVSVGDCSLPSQIFSLMGSSEYNLDYNPTTFLKVQSANNAINPSSPTGRRNNQDKNNARRYAIMFGSIFGTTFVVVLIISISMYLYVIRNRMHKEEEAKEYGLSDEADDHLDESSEMPKRFSYEELKSATGNFHRKIGRGGFGSVYEGIIGNEIIAVKCLDLDQGQGRKQFLAEVKTIGSIHHVNLVKLVGFCAENSHKLLAYEYMCNGSLDKWIFHEELTLDWKTRRKIILDIARGLSYLHEECRKRIIHLDIKPQNILLDGDFNAKVSDFGLARFIEKDESQVLTMLRGTRGYLAPEWLLNRRISEKVDVYSFGIVVLETMCGRKNLDYSQPEENECLLHLIKRKAEEDQLLDVVDNQNEEMQEHREEAVKMIRIAIWCLQGDYTRRPSMSMVVKVLEGVMDIEYISDFSFLTLTPMVFSREVTSSLSTPQLPSILSGPR